MNKSSLITSIVALGLSVVAVVASVTCYVNCSKSASVAKAGSVDAKQIEEILNNDPQMLVNALQKYEQAQREAQEREASKAFLENIDELNNNADAPFVGKKDSKVVLVEFFDFSCGYCKRLAPTMEKIVDANPDIKIVFKPITFVAPISKYAAQAALAANNQGKFMAMYKALLASTERLTEESINKIAEQNGLDMARYKADINSEKVLKTIQDVASLAEKVQIRGVPALVLNGKQLQTIEVEGIQAEINAAK